MANPSDPSNFYQSLHDYQNLHACGASGTAVCGVNIYEWGSGTESGTIDQAHLDAITAGAGTGTLSALQALLNIQTYGIEADSYFALAEYENGSLQGNGNSIKAWGISVDMGGATNNMRPQYLGLSLANQSIIGPMYACPISNNSTYNFAGSALTHQRSQRHPGDGQCAEHLFFLLREWSQPLDGIGQCRCQLEPLGQILRDQRSLRNGDTTAVCSELTRSVERSFDWQEQQYLHRRSGFDQHHADQPHLPFTASVVCHCPGLYHWPDSFCRYRSNPSAQPGVGNLHLRPEGLDH